MLVTRVDEKEGSKRKETCEYKIVKVIQKQDRQFHTIW